MKKYIRFAFASWYLGHATAISPFSSMSPRSLIVLRGGASESAASWSAGSRYNNYRTSSSQPTRSNYKTASMYTTDTKDKTKEAFAEAFLRREDRNRFIGEQLRRDDHHRYSAWTVVPMNDFSNLFFNSTFVARVYAILSGQLLFTAGTIHAFHVTPSVRDWMMWNSFGRKGSLSR